MPSTVLTGRGIDYEDLYDVMGQMKTKLSGLCAKLDLDGTVTDTDYASTIVTFTFPPAAAGREPAGGITPIAVRHQGLILDYLTTVQGRFNALNTKLDADNGGVTTYTDQNMTALTASMLQQGLYEGALVAWISSYMTKFNAVLTALDGDGNVADTNYNALWAFSKSAYIDTTGIINPVV